ncbi:hypothetical protein CGI23_26095, partial [Vibrio parahaemolyticus]|uniref:hypothetical protein n=1 Tax=Vibrio parahaemolyticus TaxID=670 RepID=UPI0011698BEE
SRTITYTPTQLGAHRLVYRLIDPAGDAHKYGAIDIAVSDGINQAPIADDKGVYTTPVKLGETAVINAADFVDPVDGDDIQ